MSERSDEESKLNISEIFNTVDDDNKDDNKDENNS